MCFICNNPYLEIICNGLCENCNSLLCLISNTFGMKKMVPYLNAVIEYIGLYNEVIELEESEIDFDDFFQDNSAQLEYQVYPIQVGGRKECSKCGEVKDATSEFFAKNRSKSDDLSSWCKVCKAEFDKINHIYRTYGLTNEVYKNMLRRQNNCCDLCGDPFTPKLKPHVDHNHKTGQIRGLVCVHCNNVLGYGREDPEIYQKAIDYVKRYNRE